MGHQGGARRRGEGEHGVRRGTWPPGLQGPAWGGGFQGLPPCAQLWPGAQGLAQTGHPVFKASNYFQSAVRQRW